MQTISYWETTQNPSVCFLFLYFIYAELSLCCLCNILLVILQTGILCMFCNLFCFHVISEFFSA